MSAAAPARNVYQQLLKDITMIYDAAMKDAGRALDLIFKKAYHSIGSRILEVEQKGDIRAAYGEHLIENIARDMTKSRRRGFSIDNVYNMRRVASTFPIMDLNPKLSWTHCVVLSSIKDDKQREAYKRKAIQKDWIVEDLKNALRDDSVELLRLSSDYSKSLPAPPKNTKPVRLTAGKAGLPVKRGVIGLYPVVDIGAKDSPEIQLDFGFRNYDDVPKTWAGRVKPGDVLRLKGKRYSLFKPAGAPVKPLLYTYAARRDRVVDGDTLWVKILQGFGRKARRKLRLSKIDAPEIDTPKGKEAKEYVERVLKSVNVFVVKTYSTDVHDRYLVDIFYLVGSDDPQTIADKGIFLNQKLLDLGLAVYWQKIDPAELAFME